MLADLPGLRMRTTGAALAAALMLLSLFTSCRSETLTSSASGPAGADQVRIGGIDWFVDYEAGLARARELERPLWVHFGENPG